MAVPLALHSTTSRARPELWYPKPSRELIAMKLDWRARVRTNQRWPTMIGGDSCIPSPITPCRRQWACRAGTAWIKESRTAYSIGIRVEVWPCRGTVDRGIDYVGSPLHSRLVHTFGSLVTLIYPAQWNPNIIKIKSASKVSVMSTGLFDHLSSFVNNAQPYSHHFGKAEIQRNTTHSFQHSWNLHKAIDSFTHCGYTCRAPNWRLGS